MKDINETISVIGELRNLVTGFIASEKDDFNADSADFLLVRFQTGALCLADRNNRFSLC